MTTDDAAPPYPVLLDRRATRPAGYSSQVVAAPGLDFYAYYALMGPALATRPRLVVMVANLRLFNPAGFRSFNDLVGFVPIAELPRLMTLPYAARGMTAPSLVLAQLAGTERGFTALLLAEGLRRRAADAEWWAMLGPERPERPGWSPDDRRARGLAAKVRETRVRSDRTTPSFDSPEPPSRWPRDTGRKCSSSSRRCRSTCSASSSFSTTGGSRAASRRCARRSRRPAEPSSTSTGPSRRTPSPTSRGT